MIMDKSKWVFCLTVRNVTRRCMERISLYRTLQGAQAAADRYMAAVADTTQSCSDYQRCDDDDQWIASYRSINFTSFNEKLQLSIERRLVED
jgi:hypothetical protein